MSIQPLQVVLKKSVIVIVTLITTKVASVLAQNVLISLLPQLQVMTQMTVHAMRVMKKTLERCCQAVGNACQVFTAVNSMMPRFAQAIATNLAV